MNRSRWIMLTFACLVLAVILLQKKSRPADSNESTAESASSSFPEHQATQPPEPPRHPASKGSMQTVSNSAPEVQPARELIGKINPIDVRAVQRAVANQYARYRGSEQLQLPTGTYDRLSLRAIPKTEYRGDLNDIVTEKLGFVFVESANPQSGRPTVLNRANGLIGVITGTILVRTTDLSATQSLAQRLSLRILHTDESIGLVYLAANPDAAAQIAKSIQGIPSVTSITLEIVESEARF